MLPEILLTQAGSHIGQADRFHHVELFPLHVLSAKGTLAYFYSLHSSESKSLEYLQLHYSASVNLTQIKTKQNKTKPPPDNLDQEVHKHINSDSSYEAGCGT